MEKRREKRLNLSRIADFARENPKLAKTVGMWALMIALAAALCISIGMRSHIHGEYTKARRVIAEEACRELYMMCQTFDQVSVPGQEVQSVVLPSMHDYYLAAKTLNAALEKGFGNRYMVLRPDTVIAIDAAFEAYDDAFRTGGSTENAQAAMQQCIDTIRGILKDHYKGDKLQ